MAKTVIVDLTGEMFENASKLSAALGQADANFTELYAGLLFERTIQLHASKVIWNLVVAKFAMTITSIDYTPDTPQGGALTATVVKAIGTATPASATTPMHIAAAINLNGAAHTVQSITPTLTPADLVLAAGDRIAVVLSGAMTVGSGLLTIRGTRT